MPNSTTISFQEWLKDHNGDVSQLVFDWDWSLSASQYTRVPAPTYASTVAVVESTSFSAPLATDADEAQVLMNFRVLVKLTEDDWGSALLSYQNVSQVVVDMTDVTHQAESGAEGGHLEWSMPGSVLISSGDDYVLSATNKNIDYSDPYANGSSEQRAYDTFNRLATTTDVRGVMKTHTYEVARGLLLSESYSDGATGRNYAYNFLALPFQITDDAGGRTLEYGAYNELVTDSLVANGVTHLVTELRDNYGRSVGYTYAKYGSVQQTVRTGYGFEWRISSAGFVYGGAVKQFNYFYLNSTNLP